MSPRRSWATLRPTSSPSWREATVLALRPPPRSRPPAAVPGRRSADSSWALWPSRASSGGSSRTSSISGTRSTDRRRQEEAMKLWWVGNLILFFGIIPLILFCLNRTVSVIIDIRRLSREILDNVVTLTGKLDELPQILDETDEVVKQVAGGA